MLVYWAEHQPPIDSIFTMDLISLPPVKLVSHSAASNVVVVLC